MYIQEWDKYQGLIEDKLHYSNILRIMRLSCQEKPHLIISNKSGLFHSQAPLPTNSKRLILKPYCNFIATLKQLYYNFITLQQLYDDISRFYHPSYGSLQACDCMIPSQVSVRWPGGLGELTLLWGILFLTAKEAVQQSIRLICLFVCLSVCLSQPWNSSFKRFKSANQSTDWD